MVIIDVGSTTTKSLLFEQGGERWRLLNRGEAATTVEAPYEDVMVGVLRAIRMVQERSGVSLLDEREQGWSLKCRHFLATSSAGGGLQMVVCGNVSRISGESAQRAALGGGAILLDIFAPDDGRDQFQRLERLRTLRPDMILLSGGVEGANVVSFIVEMCDFIRTAKPRPKFGYSHELPVIYAGTSAGTHIVEDLLGEGFVVKFVDNLRPSFDAENLGPTREAIHELFIEHVMSNAPGYGHLQREVTMPLMPTPTAVGEILSRYAQARRINILCVDIGGATTDVFSVVGGNYVRTVSANYGMSYSIGNVAATAGLDNLRRWMPAAMAGDELLNRIANKLLYPVTVPALIEDLWAEQAAAREALRLSFLDHVDIAKVQKPQGLFAAQLEAKQQEIRIDDIDLIIGSGGVLSNAPQRGQAAAMLLDAFQPVGATELMVDSVFMLPHLGAFARLDEKSALAVLEGDCLIPLGTALAPKGEAKEGSLGLSVRGQSSRGRRIEAEARCGELVAVPLAVGETAEIEVSVHGGLQWPGRNKLSVRGGLAGLILDLRGRPLVLDRAEAELPVYRMKWLEELCAGEEKADETAST